MYKFVVFFAFCLALAAGGLVYPVYRCGGLGTPLELGVSECEGHCTFLPGQLYTFEQHFEPSSIIQSMTLKVELAYLGTIYTIIDAVLPNSGIGPGPGPYIARYNIVPNDILSGQTVEIMGSLIHTHTGLLEICVSADFSIASV